MGAVVSGLAMGGVMGLIDLITNTGSLLLTRRSDTEGPKFKLPSWPSFFKKKSKSKPKSKRKRIRVEPRRNLTASISYDFIHDLTDYGEYDYDQDGEYISGNSVNLIFFSIPTFFRQ